VPPVVEPVDSISLGLRAKRPKPGSWWVFCGWQLTLGTLIPIVLLAGRHTRSNPRYVSLAGLLIALGFIGLRLNIVIPALATEEISGLSDAIASPRLSTDYSPSVSEWLLTVGIVGFGMLLFGLGEKLLPRTKDGSTDVRV
jgi:molybdopterin-containing oxidoreductase family membrane subunit